MSIFEKCLKSCFDKLQWDFWRSIQKIDHKTLIWHFEAPEWSIHEGLSKPDRSMSKNVRPTLRRPLSKPIDPRVCLVVQRTLADRSTGLAPIVYRSARVTRITNTDLGTVCLKAKSTKEIHVHRFCIVTTREKLTVERQLETMNPRGSLESWDQISGQFVRRTRNKS